MINKNKKIAFFTIGYPPESGIFVHRSIKALSCYYDFNVFRIRNLLSFNIKNITYAFDGIKVRQFYIPIVPLNGLTNPWWKILSYYLFLKVKKINNYDIIHSANLYPIGIIAQILGRKLNIPVIGQATGSDFNTYLKELSKRNYKSVKNYLNSFNYIITNSKDLKENISKYLNYKTNIDVVYRGVDFNMFNEDIEPVENFKKLHGVKFLYLGGFQTSNPKYFHKLNIKGGHILLDAWKIAENDLKECYLAIGGPGYNLKFLYKWKQSLKYPQNIIILSNYKIPPHKVPSIINSFDCVVIPSLEEGLPNLANESLACAKPVIGTNVGGIPEIITHNETGIIINPNSPLELAEALVWCSKNKIKLKEMGKAGAENIRKCKSWNCYIEKIKIIYENLCQIKKE